MQKQLAIETARRLYARYGKRNRGGRIWRVRPAPENLVGGKVVSWAVQIEIRRGFGGAAFTRVGAYFVAEDLLRLWKQYGGKK